jgi:hypothetical protein
MVVRLDDATSIETLAAVGHDDVDLAVLDQLLQLRVDRRERDSPAVSFDERVELLGAHEALQLTQDANDLSSLHRISGRGHDFIVVVAGLLSRTILINVVGIILERNGNVVRTRSGARCQRRHVLGAPAMDWSPALVLSACNAPAATSTLKLLGCRCREPIRERDRPNWRPLRQRRGGHEQSEHRSAHLRNEYVGGARDCLRETRRAERCGLRHVHAATRVVGTKFVTARHRRAEALGSFTEYEEPPPLVRPDDHAGRSRHASRTTFPRSRPSTRRTSRNVSQRFLASLHGVDVAIANFKARFAGDEVATTEPVADYLLAALGLHNVTPFRFQADIMNGVDPSPEDIAFQQRPAHEPSRQGVLLQRAGEQHRHGRHALTRAVVARPRRRRVRNDADPGFDYQTWMLAEIAALTKALTSHLSTKELS